MAAPAAQRDLPRPVKDGNLTQRWLKPHTLSQSIALQLERKEGDTLASYLSLRDREDHCNSFYEFLRKNGLNDPGPRSQPHAGTISDAERTISRTIGPSNPWSSIVISHMRVIVNLKDGYDPKVPEGHIVGAFKHQVTLLKTFQDWFDSRRERKYTAWALPCLFVICRDLKDLAKEADEQLRRWGRKPECLEEASRRLSPILALCLRGDHTEPESNKSKLTYELGPEVRMSKNAGVYPIAAVQLKVLFHLNNLASAKNVLNLVKKADTDGNLPEQSNIPISYVVTFKYYFGVYLFLSERYVEAEEYLQFALDHTYYLTDGNVRRILLYLVPLLMRRGIMPRVKATLRRVPELEQLYGPLISAIRTGSLALFDTHLEKVEADLHRAGVFLVIEQTRELCLRRAIKMAWLAEGKPDKFYIPLLQRYIQRSWTPNGEREVQLDIDEIECWLANLIFKDMIKGYLSHGHSMLVLSKQGPFPSFGKYNEKESAAVKNEIKDERF